MNQYYNPITIYKTFGNHRYRHNGRHPNKIKSDLIKALNKNHIKFRIETYKDYFVLWSR